MLRRSNRTIEWLKTQGIDVDEQFASPVIYPPERLVSLSQYLEEVGPDADRQGQEAQALQDQTDRERHRAETGHLTIESATHGGLSEEEADWLSEDG